MVLGFARVVECLVDLVAPWRVVASMVLLPSAADRLPFPFRVLAQTPQLTLVLAAGGYLVFLVLFLPLYAISFLVTAAGAWAVLLGTVYFGGRVLTQMISYPGSSKQIQRDMELEYTKNVSGRLVSFVNSLRLWLQLVRDETIVPSGMGSFRALQEEIRQRAQQGDVWVLVRALEELTANANAPVEADIGNGATAAPTPAAAAAAKAGSEASALNLSAVAEAESLLECLAELLPALEEALSMTDKLSECGSTYDFDRARQALLTAGVGGNDRLSSVFASLEGLGSKLMKLAKQVRSHRKKSTAATPSSGSGGGDVGEGVGSGASGVGHDGLASEEEAPKESGFPGAIVKSWWKSRSSYEGAAGFGLMREEMLVKSNAQQIWLTMSDGTLLDCCYARAYGGRNGTGTSSGEGGVPGGEGMGGGDGNERSSTGCVLFCNPNAGYWESTVLAADGGRNWISFYTSVGCDVFMFNYRGYGRSGGKASPPTINTDVREVVEYLREQLGVTRLAVHGESIGGVAAASVARHCQVDLLVLDRSFSSLSAVAQRLMGGWTKWAIWGFTGWEADVAADYLACRCYKVLACDPEDAIIAEGSSTKAGVSVMLELGASSSSLDVYQPPKAYMVADHTKSCPPVERVSLPLCAEERLSHLQIAHFTACLRYIARKAPRVGQANPRSPASVSARRRTRRGDLDMGADSQGAPREIEMVSIMEDGDRGGNDSGGAGGGGEGDGSAPDPLTEGLIDVSRPLGEAWVVLARIDGLCGRLLGRAVARGFDDVRAWVCCLVVLGPVMRTDTIAAAGQQGDAMGSLPVELASQRLQTLMKDHPDELGSDPFVEFTSQMLLYLAQRIAEGAPPPLPPSTTSRSPQPRSGEDNARVSRGGEGVSGGLASLGGGGVHGSAAVQDASSLTALEGGIVEDDRGYGIEFVGEDRNDLLGGACSSSSGPSVGRLLPLHCGHNNTYGDNERRMLLEHLALEGWIAPDRRPLDGVSSASNSSYRGFALE